ncbi:hypothetical protein [Neolewinella persica]|uniref:hypothetical protein n=1 Tax=Neolewinella persica TaxID=70998 RepID=UPI00047691D4|nr:hypothetical protein [Neolewinella persica]
MGQYENQILTWAIPVGITVMIALFTFIAMREENNKVRLEWKSSSQRRLIIWAGSITVFTIFALLQSNELYWIIAIGLRFVTANFVGVEANKLGRNKIIWIVLGFVEYHIALSLLYFRPQLFVPTESKIELTLKAESINDLFLNGLISEQEAEVRFRELREEQKINSQNERIDTKSSFEKSRKQVKIEVLQKALDLGMISKDEYEEKLKRIN